MLKILYLDDRREAHNNLKQEIGRDVVCVEDLITFDEWLYDDEGYKKYDLVILDLALELSGDIKLDDLRDEISELCSDDVPTYCEARIPLIGFDYFNLVINTRAETRRMLDEGRIVLLSGHVVKLSEKEIFTKQKYPNVTLLDRGKKSSYVELLQIIEEFEKEPRGK